MKHNEFQVELILEISDSRHIRIRIMKAKGTVKTVKAARQK